MSTISKSKTIYILTSIIVLAFISSSTFNYISARSALRQEIISSSLPLLSENIYSGIQKELSLPITISSAIARDSFLIDWVTNGEVEIDKIVQYLDKIKDAYNFVSTFFISEKTGNYYHYEGILKQLSPGDSHDEWYYKFISSGKSYDLDVDTDEASENVLTIFINYRLEDFDGNFLGVAGVGIRLENIADALIQKQEKYNRHIYLIDENGIIQVHSDKAKIEQISIFDLPGIADIAAILMNKDKVLVDENYVLDQNTYLVSSRYIPEMDWYIIVEQGEDKALSFARNNLLLTILIGLVTTISLIILSSITIGKFQKNMEMIASTDILTNIANRREFETQYLKAQYRAKRYNIPFTLIIIDIDNFKSINDKQGHLVGDNVLKGFCSMVEKMKRPDDLFARWGGDEFILLLEAKLEEAVVLAERLRHSASSDEIRKVINLKGNITISIGVTRYKNEESILEIMSRADEALYDSKEGGKNRVTVIE
jgi:diguanylate cyclase (GGDEF)-like protein